MNYCIDLSQTMMHSVSFWLLGASSGLFYDMTRSTFSVTEGAGGIIGWDDGSHTFTNIYPQNGR